MAAKARILLRHSVIHGLKHRGNYVISSYGNYVFSSCDQDLTMLPPRAISIMIFISSNNSSVLPLKPIETNRTF